MKYKNAGKPDRGGRAKTSHAEARRGKEMGKLEPSAGGKQNRLGEKTMVGIVGWIRDKGEGRRGERGTAARSERL